MHFEKHCWAEVNLDALVHNFQLLSRHAQPATVCCVVKAGAYGHGDAVICRTLQEAGAQWFAVSCLAEAVHLRGCGIEGEILILGHTDPDYVPELIRHGLTQTVFSTSYAQQLSQRATGLPRPISCHLKVDTGMGRLGFAARHPEEIPHCAAELAQCYALPGLRITGLYQHFAVADSTQPSDEAYTKTQHNQFCQLQQALEELGHRPQWIHCCNTAGLIQHPEWGMDLVRPGIALYGCNPSAEVTLEGLLPVLTLKTVISQVKTLAPGEGVSYGLHFVAERPTRVATLCIGYADGYPRLLSNRGICSIAGSPAPVLGRVCMDQMMVDISHIPGAQPGDEVTVFGGPGADSLNQVAKKADTIPYEIMCALALRVPRVYRKQGQVVSVSEYLNKI
ncbi:MAG: alanine racemase [Candidatus Fournierella pullistercoris]|uniref:Alanine racemase n=1 Tax=Candidatus Allofournierella pullistercoris TaxID=2838597 RepID=A0A948T089_9FIRM|nr:alanine racemase [Candidatus Fournierella pullistercoris]